MLDIQKNVKEFKADDKKMIKIYNVTILYNKKVPNIIYIYIGVEDGQSYNNE